MDAIDTEEDARSFALRLIIHYVGDIHQPLHAVSGISSDFPTGDRGGNDQWVPNVDGAGNLHAAWDSGLYVYSNDPTLVSFFSTKTQYILTNWIKMTQIVFLALGLSRQFVYCKNQFE